jgi:hypothetical protein
MGMTISRSNNDNNNKTTTTTTTTTTMGTINNDGSETMLQHVYGDEVLGRTVHVKFAIDGDEDDMEFFEGKITGVRKMLVDNGEVECEHHVSFEDGDKDWFDLVKEEQSGCLTWPDETRSSGSSSTSTTPMMKQPKSTQRDNDELEDDDEEQKEEDAAKVGGVSRKRDLTPRRPIVTPAKSSSTGYLPNKKPKSSPAPTKQPPNPPAARDSSSEDAEEEETVSEEGFDSPFSEQDDDLEDDF